MDLQGRLTDFPLKELLELCIDTMITGALTVTVEDDRYLLYFVEGHLYHASSRYGIGYDAVWPLFEVADAHYHFHSGERTLKRTIRDVTRAVLAHAQALAQAWARVCPMIAGPWIVPTLVAPPTGDHVHIHEEDWPVLSCIDGQNTIALIAQLAALEEIAACQSILHLQAQGLVALGASPPRLPLNPTPQHESVRRIHPAAALHTHATTGRFFTKLLATVPAEALPPSDVPIVAEPVQPGIPLDHAAILQLLRTP